MTFKALVQIVLLAAAVVGACPPGLLGVTA